MVFQFASCKLAARRIVEVSRTTRRFAELAMRNDMRQSDRDLCDRVHILEVSVPELCSCDFAPRRKDRKVVGVIELRDIRNNIAVVGDFVVHN